MTDRAKSDSSLQRELADLKKELEFRDKQLDLIKLTVQEVITELNFNKLINSVAKKAQLLIEADSLIVPILNKQRTHYIYRAACGKNAEKILNQSFPISVGMCGWVLTNDRPLFFSEENEWLMDEKTSWEDGMESALLVPLKSRGQIVGGLSGLGKKGGGSFTQQDHDLLSLFASHISIAIDNAQIFQELNEEKEYVETTLNSIGDAVITTDIDGRVSKINPVASKLLGCKEKELHGQLLSDVFNIINSKTRQATRNPIDQVLQHGKVLGLDGHTALISKDGTEYQIDDSVAPISDVNGNVQGAILVFRDITEEYELQIALRENQQRLQSILDNTPAVIYVKDTDGRYLLINRQFEKLFNISNEEVLGLTDYELFPEELADKFRKNDVCVVKTQAPLEIEEQAPHEDGLHTYISVKFPLFDGEKKVSGICGISTDITDRRKQEELLQRTQKMDALGQLSGGIAHDFNNQLGVIIGYLDMLQKQGDTGSTQSRWIETASRATLRCMDLTRQLLAFSRNQALEKTQVNVNNCILEMQTMIARSVTPEVDVQYQLEDNIWSSMLNEGEFGDALLNLVINARDAMPSGGQLIIESHNVVLDENQSLDLPGIASGDYIELAISDNGSGMTSQTKDRLFEPFYTTKSKGKGTGLGMAMVYGFVKRYGGHIKIYSELGLGTTVRIYLPRYKGDLEFKEDADDVLLDLPTGTETILIVDDEADLLELAENNLNSLGYQTLIAANGAEALEIFQHNSNIDMVFSDVVMPGGMSGYELIEKITAIRPGIKYLLTSGFTSKNMEKNGLSKFVDNLLSKPYRKTSLAKRIRHVLDQQEPS